MKVWSRSQLPAAAITLASSEGSGAVEDVHKPKEPTEDPLSSILLGLLVIIGYLIMVGVMFVLNRQIQGLKLQLDESSETEGEAEKLVDQMLIRVEKIGASVENLNNYIDRLSAKQSASPNPNVNQPAADAANRNANKARKAKEATAEAANRNANKARKANEANRNANRAADATNLLGKSVIHPTFGIGKVTAFKGRGPTARLTINFNWDVKHIIRKFVRLDQGSQ